MSTILHGFLILVCVAFLPGILNMVPKAALAAILVFTGYKLAKISLFKEYYRKGWDQFMPFVVTLTAIVLTDLLTGVLIGIALGIFYVIRGNFRTAIMVLNDNNNYLIRLRKDVSFFSKPDLKSKLERVPKDSILVIDVTRAEFIDKDIIETINDFTRHAHLKRIKVTVNKSLYNHSRQVLENEVTLNEQVYDDSAH
jgi:MFS superfamily sulfate permease-like transporter